MCSFLKFVVFYLLWKVNAVAIFRNGVCLEMAP